MDERTTRFVTAAQMREADRRCIEEIGIPGAVLMNNAGAAVFNQIKHGPVGVVCGKGNNGGDGFVVARLALLGGYETRVVLVGDKSAIGGDALTFLRAYENLGGDVVAVHEAEHAGAAVASLGDCAVIVDALLGTGSSGIVRDPLRAAILAWPKTYTIAVDLPSGLNADTGEAGDCCVRADVTVTFQFAKAGFRNPACREYLGRLVVADIGLPVLCLEPGVF